jgi:endoglucanase
MKALDNDRRRRWAGCLALLLGWLAAAAPAPARAAAPGGAPIAPADWQAYRAKFVREDGRVVDDGNGGISHSESQGYGLILAYLAGDRAGFERIWTFTRLELLIRDDGLAAWKWDPAANPHVTDINNASDGDLLIAYALGLAGAAWKIPAYLVAGRKIATALGEKAVRREGGKLLLMPGVEGFNRADRPDGPVVNLSYWVFEAFPVMSRLAPGTDWAGLSDQGLALVDAFAKAGKVFPEWTSLRDEPAPAAGFEAVSGYNALRVPLYVLRAGLADRQRLATIQRAWEGGPGIVDFASGRKTTPLPEPGYRMLQAGLACALSGARIPDDLRRFEPTLYYPSTLHLLGLSTIADRYPQCL